MKQYRSILEGVLFVILFFVELPMCTMSSETAESLATKVQKQIDTIDMVKFVYRFRTNGYESSNIRETRQEYAVLHSNNPNYPRRWESWKVFYEKTPGVWELDKYVVYNGKNIWTYDRVNSIDPGVFYKWSEGVAEPCVDASLTMDRKGHLDFVFHGVGGYGKTFADDVVRNYGLDKKWYIVERESHSGKGEYVLERETIFPSWDEKDKFYTRLYLSLNPVPMILRSRSSKDFSKNLKVDAFFETDAVASFEGIYYPSKGRKVICATKEVPYDVIYEFEVESVERLTEADRENWIPKWPSGTFVTDKISDKRFSVPHTQEQLLEQQDEYYAKLKVDREIKTQGRRNWLIIAVNLAGLSLIFFLIFKRRAKQKETFSSEENTSSPK